MGHIHIGRGFEGGSRPVAARLQAQLPFTLGCLQRPSDGCRHIRGGGNVQVSMLAVIPAQSALYGDYINYTSLNRNK